MVNKKFTGKKTGKNPAKTPKTQKPAEKPQKPQKPKNPGFFKTILGFLPSLVYPPLWP